MGLSAAIAVGASAAAKELVGKPPAMPAVPEPPKLTDEQKRKAETEAVNRQRAQATAATGGRDTILTGPLGLLNEPATQRRTLLGG